MTILIVKGEKRLYGFLRIFLILSWVVFTLFYILPVPLFAKGFFLLLMVITSSIYGGFKGGLWSTLWFLIIRVCYHVVVPIEALGLIGGFFAAFITACLIGIPVDFLNRKDQELEVVQGKYRQLLETLQEGIWTLDEKGYTTFVNQAMAKMLGYSIEEMEGLHFSHFIHEGAKEKSIYYLEQQKRGIKEQLEMEFVRKDKGSIYTLLATSPLFDEEGKIVGSIAGVQDITIRRRMEEELIKGRNLLQSVFEKTHEGVMILNSDLTIQQVNSTLKEWNQGSLPLEGKYCYQVFHQSNEPCHHCPTLRCMETGQMERYEMIIKTKGGVRWQEIFSYPLTEEGNETTTGAMEFVIDITKRKRAEEALLESESQFRAIFDVASVGIVQVNPKNGKMIRYNEKYREITGYSHDELGRKAFPDLTHPQDRKQDWEKFSSAVKGERPYYINEKRYIRRDGSIIWVRLNAAFIRNEKGEPIRTVAVCEDITERKEAQKRLAHSNIQLKKLYKRLQEEMEKARTIHEGILPTEIPQIDKISFAAHYQPAERLGGDFYDVILVQNKLIFYLSDVSGHGLGGTMLSLFVKHTIKNYLSFTSVKDLTPGNILQYLADQYQEENYPEEYFICIFLGVLDLEKMDLHYSGVGFQDRPLVHQGDGRRLELATKGLFITSCFPEKMKNFREGSVNLTPGTTIFLNTDGLTEQRSFQIQYLERLPQVFYNNTELPPHLIVQRVVEDFQNFNNGSLQGDDDITFLVLQVKKG